MPTTPNHPELLTLPEAARRLGVDVKRLREARDAGRLPVFVIGKRWQRVARADLVRWLEGEEVTRERLADPVEGARTLAEAVRALMAIDATGGPAPGEHNFWRGVPLAARDGITRRCIGESVGLVDTEAVTRAWERDLSASAWKGPPTWLHGDLAPDNLLVRDGRLSAVIDWGGLGVGDPATELLPAWNLFRGESRAAYREALGFDDATWARGRGLAVSTAIVALPYYNETIPVRASRAQEVIREVLSDHEREQSRGSRRVNA